jgi:hypothetical protein
VTVAIVQSSFLPWRGYFDLIRQSDLFIIYDDVQYTKGDWRNRNRIKTARGSEWITVPVRRGHLGQRIEETAVNYSTAWVRKMLRRIQDAYRGAPHLEPYFSELADLLSRPAATISELNVRLLDWACSHLGIGTPMRMSSTYQARGTKTERLIDILEQVGASTYLSGPSARAYLTPESFERAGIRLVYKTYDYPPYEQLHPPFDPAVSIIDLLFMKGEASRSYLEPPFSD